MSEAVALPPVPVGKIKSFGPMGPKYEVGHPVRQLDDGEEHSYFGRGYVQLTWWNNYAAAGQVLGRSLELLLEPEKVNEPSIAYEIISTGMRTGRGFANGRKFADYFGNGKTDYSNARAMVNKKDTDSYEPIRKLAVQFEAILLESKVAN